MPLRKRHTKAIAEGYQSLTNLVLKQHDDRYTDINQTTAQNKFQGCEVFFNGKPVEEGKCADGGGHWLGASTANQFQNCIHKQEDKDKVRDVSRLAESSQILRVWQ